MTHSELIAPDVSRTGALRRLIGRHPMVAFFVLACAISWSFVPFGGFPLGVGPLIAALIVLSSTEGVAGIKNLFRKITQWRVNWKWYALALGLPAAAAIGAAAITVALGAPAPSAAQLGMWTDIVPTFLFLVLVPLMGPWEEPGFRGFALPRLMRDRSPLFAGLVVGVMHVAWHAPLFFMGEIPVADVVYILAAAVIFAWIVVGSGGSVLLAMLMHASSNAVSGEYISPMFTGADGSTLGWIRAGIWCVFALAVVLAFGPSLRGRKSQTAVVTAPEVEMPRV